MSIIPPHVSAVESFVDTDQKYLQADTGANRDDGCTAVTAILVGQNLVVANVGDSRAVLSKGGQGEQLALVMRALPSLFISYGSSTVSRTLSCTFR